MAYLNRALLIVEYLKRFARGRTLVEIAQDICTETRHGISERTAQRWIRAAENEYGDALITTKSDCGRNVYSYREPQRQPIALFERRNSPCPLRAADLKLAIAFERESGWENRAWGLEQIYENLLLDVPARERHAFNKKVDRLVAFESGRANRGSGPVGRGVIEDLRVAFLGRHNVLLATTDGRRVRDRPLRIDYSERAHVWLVFEGSRVDLRDVERVEAVGCRADS